MSLSRPQTPPRIFLADEIVPKMQTAVRNRQSVYAAVAGITVPKASFESVIIPLIETDNLTRGTRDMIAVLRKVSPNQATRDAAAVAEQLWSAEDNIHRERLYALVQAVHERNDGADVESRKMINELRKEYKRLCLGAPGEEQMRQYSEITQRINTLRSEFLQNIRDDREGQWFTTDELAGLSKGDFDRFRTDLLRPREYFVSFKTADYYSVMRNADNENTRRRMYLANAKKLPQNVPLFKEIITLRDRSAQLLGYMSHAERQMEYRLAKSTDWVYTFLDSLQTGLIPQAKLEMDTLEARKKLHLNIRGDISEGILPWDFDYYAQLVERDSGVDQAIIAEYFPFQNTVPAVFGIFSRLLDVTFTQLTREEVAGSVWHKDVEVWAVWDANDAETSRRFLGYLFLDLFQRENKQNGELNVTLQSGFQRSDGTRNYPSTVLLASFQHPTPVKCTLLKHREVKVFMHELGHALHDLLGVTKYARFSGANTSRDFVEVPSLVLERFSWIKDVLKEISCHFTRLDERYLVNWQKDNPGVIQPPEKIPDKLLDDLIKTRTLNRACKMLGGVATSKFDMIVHDIYRNEAFINDLSSLWYKLHEELTVYRSRDQSTHGHPYVHFSHLIGAYDAGYYAYSCSQSFADDIFMELFAKDPHNRDAWRKYRRGMLEPGGSMDEMEMLEGLLGRPTSPCASAQSL